MRTIGEFSIANSNGKTEFARKSIHSGEMNSVILNLDFIDFTVRFQSWIQRKELIQDLFPSLSSDEREFIQTGITRDEWDEIFDDESEVDTELSEDFTH
mgnify:FL=1|jgi:hypothetical protein|tara:strand:- start:675 stop:971 length:297 start_codon:yes stop_codon:yes gene_type:complete